MSHSFGASDGPTSYTEAMAAESRQWKVVKTSGGYGVLKSVNGATVSKKTVVRPAGLTASKRKQSAVKASSSVKKTG
jgi:hypothetical protein